MATTHALPAAAAPSELEASTYRQVSWRLLPFLLLCYVVAYLDRVNVGFAKLQMLGDLKFSETIYGLGAGIFFIGYFIFEVPSNLILHRVGARVWIARIMISWGVLSGLMMFVSSPMMFYVMRFLLGAAEAGFFPGIILYLTYWYPARRRGHVTAVFMTAVALSGVIGGPISGFIMKDLSGVNGWAGWQWMFCTAPTCRANSPPTAPKRSATRRSNSARTSSPKLPSGPRSCAKPTSAPTTPTRPRCRWLPPWRARRCG